LIKIEGKFWRKSGFDDIKIHDLFNKMHNLIANFNIYIISAASMMAKITRLSRTATATATGATATATAASGSGSGSGGVTGSGKMRLELANRYLCF
jgi:hypothetical protein